jgi:hypothetical protein
MSATDLGEMLPKRPMRSLADRITHLLSEILNDDAPLGEERYRPAAERIIKDFGLHWSFDLDAMPMGRLLVAGIWDRIDEKKVPDFWQGLEARSQVTEAIKSERGLSCDLASSLGFHPYAWATWPEPPEIPEE